MIKMMNANEARNKTNEFIKEDVSKRMKNLWAWVEETCGKAIEEAVEARKFKTVVEVPKEYNTADVAKELRIKNFTVDIQWGGFIDQIVISW